MEGLQQAFAHCLDLFVTVSYIVTLYMYYRRVAITDFLNKNK